MPSLNGNTFLITNKQYYKAHFAQWGKKGRNMGTFECKIHPDQFWKLEEDERHPGYYYIHSIHKEGY